MIALLSLFVFLKYDGRAKEDSAEGLDEHSMGQAPEQVLYLRELSSHYNHPTWEAFIFQSYREGNWGLELTFPKAIQPAVSKSWSLSLGPEWTGTICTPVLDEGLAGLKKRENTEPKSSVL